VRHARDLAGKNIIVYDLETCKSADQCSRGWESPDEMGISVLCAFDYEIMRYRVFMDDNLSEFVERANRPGTLLVAFNQLGFDNRVIRATKIGGVALALKPDAELKQYDMLFESRLGAGESPGVRTAGFRLDDHLKALSLPMKTGYGAMAPVWWQAGQVGKVVDYALSDVAQERNLFEHMYQTGTAQCTARPTPYRVAAPKI